MSLEKKLLWGIKLLIRSLLGYLDVNFVVVSVLVFFIFLLGKFMFTPNS
jgi:hypothetical protein